MYGTRRGTTNKHDNPLFSGVTVIKITRKIVPYILET